jgi:hypothetical protein
MNNFDNYMALLKCISIKSSTAYPKNLQKVVTWLICATCASSISSLSPFHRNSHNTTKIASSIMMSVNNTQVPDIITLRNAIPAHCFKRSLVRSLSYVARDITAVSLLFYAAVKLAHADLPWALSVPLWTLNSFTIGLFFTGLWILAHECGHDSFSANPTINASIGWFLHSMLLVPFFSWKFSHSRHHRYANHMEKDTVFVPNRKPSGKGGKAKATLLDRIMYHTAADTPIVSMAFLVIHQLLGWPAYIFLNAGAGVNSLVKSHRNKTPRYKQSHLDPTSNLFTQSEQPFVVLSNVGLITVFAILYQVAKSIGIWNTFLLYGLPYLWMNHWIGKLRTREDLQVYQS